MMPGSRQFIFKQSNENIIIILKSISRNSLPNTNSSSTYSHLELFHETFYLYRHTHIWNLFLSLKKQNQIQFLLQSYNIFIVYPSYYRNEIKLTEWSGRPMNNVWCNWNKHFISFFKFLSLATFLFLFFFLWRWIAYSCLFIIIGCCWIMHKIWNENWGLKKKNEIVCLEINWTLIKINLKKFVIVYLHPNRTCDFFQMNNNKCCV